MKKYVTRLVVISMILLMIMVGCILFTISSITTSSDHDRATSLLQDVESNYAFKTISKDGNRPAVYVTGLSCSDHLSIYGDYSEHEVTDILRSVSEAQSRRSDKKTIYVEFCSVELDDKTLYKRVKIPK